MNDTYMYYILEKMICPGFPAFWVVGGYYIPYVNMQYVFSAHPPLCSTLTVPACMKTLLAMRLRATSVPGAHGLLSVLIAYFLSINDSVTFATYRIAGNFHRGKFSPKPIM